MLLIINEPLRQRDMHNSKESIRAIYLVIHDMNVNAGDDFLGLCNHKISYKHESDYGCLRRYYRLTLTIDG
jgi:hypothetical protein